MQIRSLDGNSGWQKPQALASRVYDCGHCDSRVASQIGYKHGVHGDGSGGQVSAVYLCPNCAGPTVVDRDGACLPDVPFGGHVQHLPPDINQLYDETRRCTSVGAYTAGALLARKLLMTVAVEKGAQPGKRFAEYVDFLAAEGHIPPNGKAWVNLIRSQGNDATHRVEPVSRDDVTVLMRFLEMLLRLIFEFPGMLPPRSGDAPNVTG